MLTHLGREYRQETTNNPPTKQSQHHPSHVVVNASLQIPCLELHIYAVHTWEQEIHLLASKGFILALVEYEMLLCFPFPCFTSIRTVQSQHSKLTTASPLSPLSSVLLHLPHIFFQALFPSLWNAAHLPSKLLGQRCCLMVNNENSTETWLRNQRQNTVKPGFQFQQKLHPPERAWIRWKWKTLLQNTARHAAQ